MRCMLQIIRQVHDFMKRPDQLTLIGVACSRICDEIAELGNLVGVTFISAGGCFGFPMDDRYPKFLQVVPSERRFGKVYLKLVKKFG